MTDYESAQANAQRTCSKSIVKVEQPWHIVLFVFNIFLPGLGTVLSAFMTTKEFGKEINETALIFGVI